ncbi:hypothetical protein POM88_035971 [Heracleum sosnowskyi]|uniref:Uncharacterized protein n=1 Tax=Heracleum sosnowskyi TaxID=360622 RepID=A0AAD8HMG3_9APIA|nr:hypothetical protein POM88_035971 [Heracleum sosnowskyi]
MLSFVGRVTPQICTPGLEGVTFTHPDPAYQVLAGQGNMEAERMLNLVHTTESMSRAKEAIQNLPPGAGEDFSFYEDSDDSENGEGGDVDPSTLQEMPTWLFSNSYVHNDTQAVIFRNYRRAFGEAQTSNSQHAPTVQNFVASLQLYQAHILQQQANTDDIKNHLDGVKDALARRIDVVAPPTSQRCKQDKLVKDVDVLTERMDKMEKQMDTFLANQNLQTQLLQRLLQSTVVTQTLDDNKKGENSSKGESALVVFTTQGVPSSQGESPQIIANPSKFQLTKVVSPRAEDVQVFLNSEKLIKESIFQAVTSSTSSHPVHTTILKVLTPDTIVVQSNYDAEHSSVKEFEPFFSGRTGSPPKHHGKNKLDVDFPLPKPDENKVLATHIMDLNNSKDVKLRQGLAVIYRNGKELHITSSHPRRIVFEDPVPTSTQSQVTFHGTPVEFKEEPIEFEDLLFPKFLIEKEKISKKRILVKKAQQGPIKLNVAPKVAKPVENKAYFLYIADIQEYSTMDLFLEEVSEISGTDKFRDLPERLTFVYKGGKVRAWPLQQVLNVGYSTLVKVFLGFKYIRGFSEIARGAVLKKIEEIRSSWNSPDCLPRKLKIPFNGQRIHLQPYWMMEFKDEKGCRRFFRIEDQLSKASNRYLRWLQDKLDPKIAEEDAFYRKLQEQIQANYAKEGRQKVQPPREKKRN